MLFRQSYFFASASFLSVMAIFLGCPAFAQSQASSQAASQAETHNTSQASTKNSSKSRSTNQSAAGSTRTSKATTQNGSRTGFSRGTLSGPQPAQGANRGTQSNNGAGVTPPNNGDSGNSTGHAINH